MRVLEWALESQKTVRGKIISVVLSVALIFSFSNFFYGDNAFAEEEVSDVTTQNEEVVSEMANAKEVTNSVVNNKKSSENIEVDQQSLSQASADESVSSQNKVAQDASAIEEQLENTEAEKDSSQITSQAETADETNCPFTATFEGGVLTVYGNGEFAGEFLVDGELKDWMSMGYGVINKVILQEGITSIADDAFNMNWVGRSMKEIVLPTSLTHIGARAFAYGNLEKINLDHVTSIDEYAFQQNGTYLSYGPGLEELVIPGGMISISENAFSEMRGLKRVIISEGVTSIGDQAFKHCESLETVTLPESLKKIGNQAFSNCNALKTAGETEGVFALKGIDEIGSQIIESTNVESLVLENIKTINSKAFQGVLRLNTVEAVNIGTIGQNAFNGCKKLETVRLNKVNTIGALAFSSCINLENLEGLDSVGRIDGYAFYKCGKLNNLLTGLLKDPNFAMKLGFNGNYGDITEYVTTILGGEFKLDQAEDITELQGEEGWEDTTEAREELWNTYNDKTQVIQQARWVNEEKTEAQVKVDAYFTAEQQMDYVFVADLSSSMAQLGNVKDNNARFYDMQSKLIDMISQLMDSEGYDCNVTIVTFGGYVKPNPGKHEVRSFTNVEEALDYVKSIEPYYENTDYKLGLNEALEVVANNSARNNTVVFLSDGQPTYDGSESLTNASQERKDQYTADIANIANQIRSTGAEIYGVLHSPSSSNQVFAAAAMKAVCNGDEGKAYWKSTDTESFSKAMNNAFTASYGTYTLTIPVGDDFENVNNISVSVSAGEAEYDAESNCVKWTLRGMPFTKHTLLFNASLKQSSIDRDGYGTHDYLNNGAGPDLNGATIALGDKIVNKIKSTTLTREVLQPVTPVDPEPTPTPDDPTPTPTPDDPTPTPAPNPGATTTPAAPAGVGPVIPAATPAATPAVAPAAPAADEGVGIPDDENPLAAGVDIADDENPLAAFDTPQCWVHYLMIIGIILTVIYGAAVVTRCLGYARKIDKIDKDMTGIEGTSESAKHTHGVAHHA